MPANAQVGLDIVASDKTAKGFASAEKRAQKLGQNTAKALKPLEKIGSGSTGKGLLKTFGEIEKAASRAFGLHGLSRLSRRAHAFRELGQAVGSGFGRISVAANDSAEAIGGVEAAGEGVATKLGGVAVAGLAAGVGLDGAAVAGVGLVAALGPVAIVAGATVAVLGAAAVAGYKFAAGWAAAAASLGRLSETIGITARNMQELQGAGERYGISKDATAGAIGNFATTVHDARFGRNNEALALMSKLGVGFKYKSDGTLDYDRMSLDFADSIKRQKDPQTQLMLANRFGVTAMLPMLRKGSRAVMADEADVGRNGVVNTNAQIATAQAFQRNSVRLGQIGERKLSQAQAAAAGVYAPTMGWVADKLGTSSQKFEDSSKTFSDAVDKFSGDKGPGKYAKALVNGPNTPAERAYDRQRRENWNRIKGAVGSAASWVGSEAGSFADRIRNLGEHSRDDQVSPKGARSSMQVMPYTAAHPGFGITPARDGSAAELNRVGREYAAALLKQYGGDETLAAAAYNAGPSAVNRWIKHFGDPRKGQISDAQFAAHIPYGETRAYVGRVTHVHEFHGLPAGTKVKTHTKGSDSVAISHAWEEWTG